MKQRVVITGMGICAPNGTDLPTFTKAMYEGLSGIRKIQSLQDLGFRCQVAGAPPISETTLNAYFTPLEQKGLNCTGLVYGTIAGVQAWEDAGLAVGKEGEPDWEAGVVFGTSILGVAKFREAIHRVDAGQVRRLGSTTVPQTMASGISAFLGGKLGCGNQVSTNSAACSTGTEAILMAYERIASGKATRMLAGSCSDSGPYIWGGFDAMRVVPSRYNDTPETASRPMSASASGFVPSSGAGALMLESLESALARKVPIYAEVLGGAVNCGGQRNGGSMTASNAAAVRNCIRQALGDAGVGPESVDLINGHLTATSGDPAEIHNWCEALERKGADFPYINSFKDVLGHGLAASGSMECVATVLQFKYDQIIGNRNAGDLHPEIASLIGRERVPEKNRSFRPEIIAKASLGFGDVNACVIFKRFNP